MVWMTSGEKIKFVQVNQAHSTDWPDHTCFTISKTTLNWQKFWNLYATWYTTSFKHIHVVWPCTQYTYEVWKQPLQKTFSQTKQILRCSVKWGLARRGVNQRACICWGGGCIHRHQGSIQCVTLLHAPVSAHLIKMDNWGAPIGRMCKHILIIHPGTLSAGWMD